MGATYDDLEDHEGYGRNLGPEECEPPYTARAWRAACRCGWTGGRHPADDEGYEAALEEWDAQHAQPLLARAVPRAVTAMSGPRRPGLRCGRSSAGPWPSTPGGRPPRALAPMAPLAPTGTVSAGRSRSPATGPAGGARGGPGTRRAPRR